MFWVGPRGGGVATSSGVSDQSYPRCCCHSLCWPDPARPCGCPGPYVPLAHEFAVLGPCRSVPAWCVVGGVHPPAPGRVCVGTLSLTCLVLHPCVVAQPADRVRFCPGALACDLSCFSRVRPCAQGCCSRYPPGSGVMSDLHFFFLLPSMLPKASTHVALQASSSSVSSFALVHRFHPCVSTNPSLREHMASAAQGSGTGSSMFARLLSRGAGFWSICALQHAIEGRKLLLTTLSQQTCHRVHCQCLDHVARCEGIPQCLL